MSEAAIKDRGSRRNRLLVNLAVAAISTALSVLALFWITETFFFDKFYYRKSVRHGYWNPDKELTYEDFGPRAADLVWLKEGIRAIREGSEASGCDGLLGDSGAGEEEEFVIALIGDSLIWGAGLTHEERLATRLEKKLDRIAPTRVVSLGNNGDNLIENYLKYHWAHKLCDRIDLWLFGLVSNDLLSNGDYKYDPRLFADITAPCSSKPLYLNPGLLKERDLKIPYGEHVRRSYDRDQYGSFCVAEKLAAHWLPREDTLYFLFGGPHSTNGADLQAQLFRDNGLRVLDPQPIFAARHADLEPADFWVSKRDHHPSSLINRILADFLFEEISGLMKEPSQAAKAR